MGGLSARGGSIDFRRLDSFVCVFGRPGTREVRGLFCEQGVRERDYRVQ